MLWSLVLCIRSMLSSCTFYIDWAVLVNPDLVSADSFCFIPLPKEILWVQLLTNWLWGPVWLVLHTCVVQMHLSMNVHKGRRSCNEIVSGDRMRLTALGTATSGIVVISPMPSMRPDLGRCWALLPCVQSPFSFSFIYTSHSMVAATW